MASPVNTRSTLGEPLVRSWGFCSESENHSGACGFMSFDPIQNAALLEEYERHWRQNPESLDDSWRSFFLGVEFGGKGLDRSHTEAQVGVLRLVFAHRDLGHRSAYLDSLNLPPEIDVELRPERYGLNESHFDKTFGTNFSG